MSEIKEKTDGSIKLKGMEARFILIPESFIHNLKLPNERIALLSYLIIGAGMNNRMLFTLKDVCQWTNSKLCKDREKNTSTMRIMSMLNDWKKQEFISFSEKLSFSSTISIYFDKDKVVDMCRSNRFARIYIDELEKIMQYNKGRNHILTNSVLLLVFAYLRMNIPVRSTHEGLNYGAEAYNDSFKQIGIELGLSERIVSKAVSILADLDLIRVKYRDPIQYKVGSETKFKTATSIFCNTYKRMKIDGHTHLIASGESYYLKEIAQKEEQLRKMRI